MGDFRMKRLFLAAAVTFGLSSAGYATTVGFDIDGSFSNANGGLVYNSQDSYGWGTGGPCGLFCPSTLKVSDGSDSDNYANGHHNVDLMSLTWENNSNVTHPQTGVDLTINLNWTAPGSSSGSEMYSLAITNTSDGWFGLHPQDDTIDPSLNNPPLDFAGLPDNLGGGVTVESYFWDFSGDGSFANGKWSNPETGTAVATLKAKISVVPLPAGGLLLLTGLGGLAALRRRKQAA